MKGILFKDEMVKAIIAGSKTQTRRLMKPQPIEYGDELCVKSRYQGGEIVYVKEAYTYVTLAEKDTWKDKAIQDGSLRHKPDGQSVRMCYKVDGYEIGAPWLTPLFMPAWAARHFLQIEDVREQRLQEITEADAKAEGAQMVVWHGESAFAYVNQMPVPTYRAGYANLWDSINKKPGTRWEENPWLFAYTFKVVPRPEVLL